MKTITKIISNDTVVLEMENIRDFELGEEVKVFGKTCTVKSLTFTLGNDIIEKEVEVVTKESLFEKEYSNSNLSYVTKASNPFKINAKNESITGLYGLKL